MTRTKAKQGHVIKKRCHCKGKTRRYPEGGVYICPYCNGTGKRTEKAVHPSHKMTPFRSEILAPCGTPRFYAVRTCKVCGLEEARHAAGHFLNGLDFKCKGGNQ